MNNIIADEVFILRKNLNRVNSEIEEIKRNFEIKYPNSVVTINSKLGDLYKKRNRLSTTLAEIECSVYKEKRQS